MRIIAGEAGGRRILGAKREPLRPTTDRVKEALFNILRENIMGSWVLDLYAGTGSLGLEALSRGARGVTFVDSNTTAIRIIRENLDSLNYTGRAKVFLGDALLFLRKSVKEGEGFDLILADPPYDQKFHIPTPKSLKPHNNDRGLGKFQFPLSRNGLLVIQHHKKVLPDVGEENGLMKIMERKFGETVLTFFEKMVIG